MPPLPRSSRKIVVVGAGWAGLGATHHLAKQGYEVTLLEASSFPGGLVAGGKTLGGRSVEAGVHGFWYPYKNIFALTQKLGLSPFTPYTRSCQYSLAGLEVESLILQDQPRLPAPLGNFFYTNFKRLPIIDRLSAIPFLYAVIDFDNSARSWQRYDSMTARELFRNFGVSARLYRDSFEPMLLVGLFAPGEQCSAAATLGMLYYFILAHQSDFDVVWCKGTVGEEIFQPWIASIEGVGGRLLTQQKVTDLIIDNNRVSGVVCGDETFAADAVIFAVGVKGMQKIVNNSSNLQQYQSFRDINNLGAIDVLATRLWFDRRISIPQPSNACFGFDRTTGWTFFDLNTLHDEYKNINETVVEVDFYHSNQMMHLEDKEIISLVQNYLAKCISAFKEAEVIESSVIRLPQAVTHFAPGSYQHMLQKETVIENVFMSGDWIKSSHGSWSQEKAYVTGLEAANQVINKFAHGVLAQILPVEEDELHIKIARTINHIARQSTKNAFPDFWLP